MMVSKSRRRMSAVAARVRDTRSGRADSAGCRHCRCRRCRCRVARKGRCLLSRERAPNAAGSTAWRSPHTVGACSRCRDLRVYEGSCPRSRFSNPVFIFALGTRPFRRRRRPACSMNTIGTRPNRRKRNQGRLEEGAPTAGLRRLQSRWVEVKASFISEFSSEHFRGENRTARGAEERSRC